MDRKTRTRDTTHTHTKRVCTSYLLFSVVDAAIIFDVPNECGKPAPAQQLYQHQKFSRHFFASLPSTRFLLTFRSVTASGTQRGRKRSQMAAKTSFVCYSWIHIYLHVYVRYIVHIDWMERRLWVDFQINEWMTETAARERGAHRSIITNNLYVCSCFGMATNQPFSADACGLPKWHVDWNATHSKFYCVGAPRCSYRFLPNTHTKRCSCNSVFCMCEGCALACVVALVRRNRNVMQAKIPMCGWDANRNSCWFMTFFEF